MAQLQLHFAYRALHLKERRQMRLMKQAPANRQQLAPMQLPEVIRIIRKPAAQGMIGCQDAATSVGGDQPARQPIQGRAATAMLVRHGHRPILPRNDAIARTLATARSDAGNGRRSR